MPNETEKTVKQYHVVTSAGQEYVVSADNIQIRGSNVLFYLAGDLVALIASPVAVILKLDK